MASAAEWNEIAAALRLEPSPFRSPHLPRLYEVAIVDGPRLLGAFRRRLGDERILDLVHDLLAAKLEAIVAADEPRALFCTALQRRAISWLRRGDAAVAEAPPDVATVGVTLTEQDDRQGFVLDARSALDGLSPRDRAMAVAVHHSPKSGDEAVDMLTRSRAAGGVAVVGGSVPHVSPNGAK